MSYGNVIASCTTLAVILLAASAHADSFRCGQRIATEDMTVQELREACGEPTSRTVLAPASVSH